MITVLFFAATREKVGTDKLTVADTVASVSELVAYLNQQSPKFEAALGGCFIAVNQTMATSATAITNGDEVAFFPPVTGG